MNNSDKTVVHVHQPAGCGCGCGAGCETAISRRRLLGAGAAFGAALLVDRLASDPLAAESTPGGQMGQAAAPVAKIYKAYASASPKILSWVGPNDRAWLAEGIPVVERCLADLEKRLGNVQFVGEARPFKDVQNAAAAVAQAKDADGILMVGFGEGHQELDSLLALGMPTVAFNRMGQAFDAHFWELARRQGKNPKMIVASSRDFSELERGVRLLRVPGMMKQTRLLVVGNRAGDGDTVSSEKIKKQLGVEAVALGADRIGAAYQAIDPKAAEAEAEQYWIKPAKHSHEAQRKDIVGAARLYLAIREIMAKERAQAIAIDCLGALTEPAMDKEGYPCLALAKLEDEGWATSCQCDMDCALTKIVLRYVTGLPAFMGNVFFETGKGRIIYDHCTSPTNMAGARAQRQPFDVTTHHTRTGAAPRVFMPLGQTVTVAKFTGLGSMLCYSGKITANVEGLCRTAFEVEPLAGKQSLANWSNKGALNGLHRVVCYGDHVRDIKDLAALLGLQVLDDA